MKRAIFILLCTCLCIHSRAQQTLDLNNGTLTNGVKSTVPTRSIQNIDNGYVVTYTFETAIIQSDNLYEGSVFWKIDGFGLNEVSGEPSTLHRNDCFLVPANSFANVEVTGCTYNDFEYELTPAHMPLCIGNNETYTKTNVPAIEPYQGFKPITIVSIADMQAYRGQKLCEIVIEPIQYDYEHKKVRAYTSITYKLTFETEPDMDSDITDTPNKISHNDSFLSNIIADGASIATSRTTLENGAATADIKDYLIITTSKYLDAANKFAEWKRLLGFSTHILSHDDWTSSTVKAAVTEQYRNLPSLYYLLIIGDNDDVPSERSVLRRLHITDYYFGCIDSDNLPDIYNGRLPVSSIDEANVVVDKIINYEKTPPTSRTFYENALHCAYFQDDNQDGYADRMFAQSSECVRDYVLSHGKNIQRAYYTKPAVTPQYWNKSTYSLGEPIPNELKKPGFTWTANGKDITKAINNGVFYLLHRDHGAISMWEHPSYTKQDISGLANGNLLPVVFSINCSTGKFDDNCFAETFLRKEGGGCVGIFAATNLSYSGYNDALTTGMFDAIWPAPGLSIKIKNGAGAAYSHPASPIYTLGQILSQGMVRVAETYGRNDNTKYTRELFHCFGDPSMHIHTEYPTEFSNVTVLRNSTSVDVKLDKAEIARITIYNPDNGEVQSYIGNSVSATVSNPENVTICISAHNKVPYIDRLDVKYIQNTNLKGTITESHDLIKVGSSVTSKEPIGYVTTTNANVTLRAKKVVLDKGTFISKGSTLKVVNQ